jgi:hypothetical protein
LDRHGFVKILVVETPLAWGLSNLAAMLRFNLLRLSERMQSDLKQMREIDQLTHIVEL